MKKFQVNIILNEDDVEALSPIDYCSNTWSDMLYDDYTKMELFNDDTKTIIIAGDTTHDNIYAVIYHFIQGMNYMSTEGFMVEYGFKTPNKYQTAKVEYFKGEK